MKKHLKLPKKGLFLRRPEPPVSKRSCGSLKWLAASTQALVDLTRIPDDHEYLRMEPQECFFHRVFGIVFLVGWA